MNYHSEKGQHEPAHDGLIDGRFSSSQTTEFLGIDILEHENSTGVGREGVRVYVRCHDLPHCLE
jgi:hypothetical protein